MNRFKIAAILAFAMAVPATNASAEPVQPLEGRSQTAREIPALRSAALRSAALSNANRALQGFARAENASSLEQTLSNRRRAMIIARYDFSRRARSEFSENVGFAIDGDQIFSFSGPDQEFISQITVPPIITPGGPASATGALSTPLPAAAPLLFSGLAGLALALRRRRAS